MKYEFGKNWRSKSDKVEYSRSVFGKQYIRELTKNFVFVSPVTGEVVLIPEGFQWDGSSVPRPFQLFISRWGNSVASLVHDYRCCTAETMVQREIADAEYKFLLGLKENSLIQNIGYAGVRIGAYLGIGFK